MGEVLVFKPKETVHILKFTAPRPLKMRKTGKERISVELHKVDENARHRSSMGAGNKQTY